MPAADPNTRLSKFKFKNKLEESRRKRSEDTIELRKQKKQEQIFKRRNMTEEDVVDNSPAVNISADMDEMIANLSSTDLDVVLHAMQSCRKVLSRQHNPPIDIMLSKGIVPKCIKYLLCEKNPSLQFETAWVLTNIASGTHEQTKAIIENGAIEPLIKLLKSEHMNVVEQAVWALGNIAGDGAEGRNKIFSYRPMATFAELCSAQASNTLIKNVVWTISNLCRSKEADKIEHIKPVLKILRDFLTCHDKEIIVDTCWSWSYLTDGPNEKIQMCIDAKVVPLLVQWLQCEDPTVLTPVLRALGNIVTGDDAQTDVVINNGILNHLEKLLNHDKRNLVKECAWTISNITAGNIDQIQRVLDAGLLNALINVLHRGDPKSSKEAAFAIMNITTGGTVNQIGYMVQQGIFLPLSDLLESNDPQIISLSLDAISNILKAAEKIGELNSVAIMLEQCEGVDRIEQLQSHDNNAIYQKALIIIDMFFSREEVDENCAPEMNKDGLDQLEFNITKEVPKEGFQF